MADSIVTVALPVRNGERYLGEVLEAVRGQVVDRPVELLVVDSGSTDRSIEIARSADARVFEIPPEQFSHGGTRNLMMKLANGDHVVFLSQDATPASDRWLSRLLEGFELAGDVALTFGPYEARPGSSAAVSRELRDYFGSFTVDSRPTVQSLAGASLGQRLPGPLTFFTDANGCVARWAWEEVPYREAPYAEDHLLACEMLEAGYSKVFHPGAVVYHSHEYSARDRLRRCFDEWRGLAEVYGYREPLSPRRHVHRVRREVALDRVFLRDQGVVGSALGLRTLESLRYHVVRQVGSILGGRADRFPARVRASLSLERRSTFVPAPPPREQTTVERRSAR